MLHYSRTETLITLLIVGLGLLLVVPDLVSPETRAKLPGWAQRTIVLGLDLQGGSHILLEVDANALRAERQESLRDQVRTLLREERVGYSGLGNAGNGVQVRLREAGDVDRATTKLRELAQPVTTSLFGGASARDLEVAGTPDGVITLTPTEDGVNARIRSAVDQSIEIVRRRVDELGTTEPSIQRQGADRILVQVPGLQDPQRLKELIGTTAKLSFRMVDLSMPVEQAAASRPPAESEILPSTENPNERYLIERRVLVSGEDLIDAQPGFSQQNNEPIVSFRFNSQGARRFATATTQNVGKPFAIVLDNKVISAPRINEPITGGSGQISGSFTVESANNLAILLRAGALPAPLTVVEERTVGPGLGREIRSRPGPNSIGRSPNMPTRTRSMEISAASFCAVVSVPGRVNAASAPGSSDARPTARAASSGETVAVERSSAGARARRSSGAIPGMRAYIMTTPDTNQATNKRPPTMPSQRWV